MSVLQSSEGKDRGAAIRISLLTWGVLVRTDGGFLISAVQLKKMQRKALLRFLEG